MKIIKNMDIFSMMLSENIVANHGEEGYYLKCDEILNVWSEIFI